MGGTIRSYHRVHFKVLMIQHKCPSQRPHLGHWILGPGYIVVDHLDPPKRYSDWVAGQLWVVQEIFGTVADYICQSCPSSEASADQKVSAGSRHGIH